MEPIDRHAVLADPTRRALLQELSAAPAPRSIASLAASLGLHANSVREQLRRLEAAGLVRASLARPSGRGRPGLRFEAIPGAQDPYRVLAGVLADEVAALPGAPGVWTSAGERWGREAAAALGAASAALGTPDAASTDHTDQVTLAAVTGLLDDAGFAPEPLAPGDEEIRLHACPFLPIDRRRLPVVCGVHLGFVRGALRELGSSWDAVSIEPFVRPDLCVARIGRMSRA
jgi:predicted ArsR family transcriptional regulator